MPSVAHPPYLHTVEPKTVTETIMIMTGYAKMSNNSSCIIASVFSIENCRKEACMGDYLR
jgi:hypothetical protein